MNAITIVILVFSMIGAVDWLIGDKLGVGKLVAGVCAAVLACLLYKDGEAKEKSPV